MAAEPGLEALWQPLRLGPATVRNRIMAGPSTLLYAEDNVLSDRHIAFWRERALGGAGLLVTEEHGAHRLGIGAFPDACTAWHPRAIPQMAKLADAVHEHGATQLVQLYAPGAEDSGTLIMDRWHPLWAPSRVSAPGRNEAPVAMDREQIAELVEGFATSARNVEAAGLDGVEIHAAHGWLIGQFLSPWFNRREDGYGGSVHNRTRLALEIAEAIRSRTRGSVLGVQLSVDEYIGERGITPEQTDEQLGLLAASGLFDYVTLSTGSQHATHWTIPSMEVPEGFLAEHGTRAKRIVGDRLAVILVGRVRGLATAARLVAEGAADIVAMTRAQFADPHLVRKGREGRLDEIVPCVGENDCIVRAFSRLPVTCLMNPAMGREREWGAARSTPTPQARRVVVVGGGPAGLKAATVASRRGHDVSLLERRGVLGGHLEPLSRLPGREGWKDAIASLERDARRAGVDVRLETHAGAAKLIADAPDVVLCATGATWDRSGASPARPGEDPVDDPTDEQVLDMAAAVGLALDDPERLGDRVLIVDESGEYLPLGLADALSARGARVELVTRHPVVGATAQMALDGAHVLRRLARRDVRLTPGHELEWVGGGRVILREGWSGRRRTIADVDRVVLSMLRTPDDALARELRVHLPDVRPIGDALAPRRTHEVIYEAEVVARAL